MRKILLANAQLSSGAVVSNDPQDWSTDGATSVWIALTISNCTCGNRGTALKVRGSGGFMCLIS
jgi:hypothetical protein